MAAPRKAPDRRESTFETTDDHPWRTTFDKWVRTIDLRPGDLLRRAQGASARVVSVRKTGRTAPTFNLEVADFHTYFVGAEKIWVHNACDPELAQELAKQAARGSSEARRIMQGLIKDPRFPENTWGKFEYVHRGLNGKNITVHFWRNLLDGIETGFKVK